MAYCSRKSGPTRSSEVIMAVVRMQAPKDGGSPGQVPGAGTAFSGDALQHAAPGFNHQLDCAHVYMLLNLHNQEGSWPS